MKTTDENRRFLTLLVVALLTASVSLAGNDAATIGIHIAPGSTGPVRVAVLGSGTLDVKTLDLTTIRLAGAPLIVQPDGTLRGRLEDVNRDGTTDLVVEVDRARMQCAVGDTTAALQVISLEGKAYRGSGPTSD